MAPFGSSRTASVCRACGRWAASTGASRASTELRTDVITKLGSLCVLACGLVLLVGCSRQGSKVEDFTPPSDKAQKALEAALNHWQSGHPPGTVPGTSPSVEVVDSKWK